MHISKYLSLHFVAFYMQILTKVKGGEHLPAAPIACFNLQLLLFLQFIH